MNNIDDDCYVGSSIKTWSQRVAEHRSRMKTRPQDLLYKHMHELGVKGFYIELINNYSCKDIYELRAREGYYIREIGTLNKQIAGRHTKQYKEYNKEHYK